LAVRRAPEALGAWPPVSHCAWDWLPSDGLTVLVAAPYSWPHREGPGQGPAWRSAGPRLGGGRNDVA